MRQLSEGLANGSLECAATRKGPSHTSGARNLKSERPWMSCEGQGTGAEFTALNRAYAQPSSIPRYCADTGFYTPSLT